MFAPEMNNLSGVEVEDAKAGTMGKVYEMGKVAYTEKHWGPRSERTEGPADASVAIPVGSGDAVAFGGGSGDEFSEPRSPQAGRACVWWRFGR